MGQIGARLDVRGGQREIVCVLVAPCSLLFAVGGLNEWTTW